MEDFFPEEMNEEQDDPSSYEAPKPSKKKKNSKKEPAQDGTKTAVESVAETVEETTRPSAPPTEEQVIPTPAPEPVVAVVAEPKPENPLTLFRAALTTEIQGLFDDTIKQIRNANMKSFTSKWGERAASILATSMAGNGTKAKLLISSLKCAIETHALIDKNRVLKTAWATFFEKVMILLPKVLALV